MRKEVRQELVGLSRHGRLRLEGKYFQHGTTTVLEHSVKVAVVSLWLADRLGLRVDRRSLIRGALLHDYFLYDWHEKHQGHRLHGFRHPQTALRKAEEDFTLTDREKNIIARHMFPLVPVPPTCREAWLVCLADKYCAAAETAQGMYRRFLPRQRK